MYRIRIIESKTARLPERLRCRRFKSLEKAYDSLANFVHGFDRIEQVDGSVMDCSQNDEDIEFVSSFV